MPPREGSGPGIPAVRFSAFSAHSDLLFKTSPPLGSSKSRRQTATLPRLYFTARSSLPGWRGLEIAQLLKLFLQSADVCAVVALRQKPVGLSGGGKSGEKMRAAKQISRVGSFSRENRIASFAVNILTNYIKFTPGRHCKISGLNGTCWQSEDRG